MKRAIIFGATGFIGSYLVKELLASSDYSQVAVVVRNASALDDLRGNAKLKVLVADFQSLPSLKAEIVADDVFIALGTTKNLTPNEAEYYQVDHDYPVLAARLAQGNGAKSVFIVTAIGADAKSRFFYVRTKGEVERDIIALGFRSTQIFQPSMITGARRQHRALERFLVRIWAAVDLVLVGPLARYRGIRCYEVARAMVRAAKDPVVGVKVWRWGEMKSRAEGPI